MTILDRMDQRILNELQSDGRLSNVELSNRIGLSESACLRRVKNLESIGIIDKYVALVEQEKWACQIMFLCRLAWNASKKSS